MTILSGLSPLLRRKLRARTGAWAACIHTDRIGRTVSCFDAVESCCVGSPADDDVSCAAVAVVWGSLPEHDCASCRYWEQ
jgi:hypothetical protein